MRSPAPTGQDRPAAAARRVAKNTFYLLVADIIGRAMSAVFFLVAARHLGVAGFGTLSFALALVTMLAVLADMGLGLYVARELARDVSAADRLVSTGAAVRLTAGLVLAALVILLAKLLGYPPGTVRVVALCSVFIVANSLIMFYAGVFQGYERNAYTAVGRFAQTAVLVFGALLLSRGPASPERYAALYAGASLLALAITAIIVYSRFVRFALSFAVADWRSILRPALPFGITAVLVAFYYWNGSVLLSKLVGDEAVGIYSAPFRLVTGLCVVGTAFSGALYPLMSRTYVRDEQYFRQVVARAGRYVAALAVPLALLGPVLSRPVVMLVYGSGYEASIPIMRILVIWAAFVYANSFLSNLFFSINRPRVVTMQAAISLAVNLTANVVLIPPYGAMGAACAIAAAEAAGFAFLLSRHAVPSSGFSMRAFLGGAVRTLCAAVLVVPLSWLAGRWHVAAGLGTALAGYVSLLLLFRGIRTDDIRLLRVVFRRDDG